MSTFSNLQELYVDQLQDTYSANKQMAAVLAEFEGAAKSDRLKSHLRTSHDKIVEHQNTLETIIKGHDANPNGEHCKGMEGLVREGRAHGLEPEFTDQSVQDAAIITQLNRMNHYGLACYGTTKAMAEQLGLADDAKKLGSGLEDVYDGDAWVSVLAEEKINERAAA